MVTARMPTPHEALDLYRPQVENSEQAVPVLLFVSAEHKVLAPVEVPRSRNAADVMPLYLSVLIQQFGRPRWLVFSFEAWKTSVPQNELQERYRRNWLSDRHDAGDSSVVETVGIIGVDRDTQWWLDAPFRRTSDGVQWSEPEVSEEVEGDLVPILSLAVRGRRQGEQEQTEQSGQN